MKTLDKELINIAAEGYCAVEVARDKAIDKFYAYCVDHNIDEGSAEFEELFDLFLAAIGVVA